MSKDAYNPHESYPMHNQGVQQPTSTVVVTSRPNDYFGFALFTCLCCFWPTGIAALVFSCNSKSAADRMDYSAAEKDGRTAKIFSIVSLVIGLLWIIGVIIYVILLFTLFASYATANNNLINSLDKNRFDFS